MTFLLMAIYDKTFVTWIKMLAFLFVFGILRIADPDWLRIVGTVSFDFLITYGKLLTV